MLNFLLGAVWEVPDSVYKDLLPSLHEVAVVTAPPVHTKFLTEQLLNLLSIFEWSLAYSIRYTVVVLSFVEVPSDG